MVNHKYLDVGHPLKAFFKMKHSGHIPEMKFFMGGEGQRSATALLEGKEIQVKKKKTYKNWAPCENPMAL